MQIYRLCTILFCCSIFFDLSLLYAVTIGSDSLVNRFTGSVSLGNGDIVASFASLEGGFSISGILSNALFRSVFPVGGTIAMRQGTVTLGTDWTTQDSSKINSLGSIVGNGYEFDLAHSITLIPALPDRIFDCDANFVTSVLHLSDVETSDWSYDGQFVAVGLEVGGAQHPMVLIYRFNGSTLTLTDSSLFGQYQDIRSVRWHPTKYLLAVVRKQVGVGLQEVMIIDVNPVTGLMTQVSGNKVNADVAGCAWHPSGNFLATTRNINAAEIAIYAVNGVGLLSGPVVTVDYSPDRMPRDESISWDATGTYLAVGTTTNIMNPTLLIYAFNAGVPSLTLNASINTTGHTEGVDFNPTFTNFLAVARSGIGQQLEIYKHNPTAPLLANRLVKVAGAALSDTGRAVAWEPDGSCVSVGKDISGNGEFRIYFFNPISPSLSLLSSFDSTGAVITTRWSKSGLYVTQGGDDNTLYIYKVNGNSSGDITFYNLLFSLGNDLTIRRSRIHFDGNCIINGRGHVLTLEPTCTLLVNKRSTLLFEDVMVRGVNTNKIQCLDNTSTISCQNVLWNLDGNFSFTTGRLDIIDDFCLSGDGYTFSYQTNQVAKIGAQSTLAVDRGCAFSYSPLNNLPNLVQFTDYSSQFWLKDAFLFVSAAGLQLQKGTFIVDGKSYLMNQGVNQAQGFILGDGLSSANNQQVKWLGESGLFINKGWFVYKNLAS